MPAGDLFGSIASGAASGASTGASLGSLVPGIGTAAGAAGGAILGGVTSGLRQARANRAENIPAVDPQEQARLSRLEQISRNISAGTDPLTRQNISDLRASGRAAQTAITRSTGGDVSGTVDALLRSQGATQAGINQATAQAAQRIPYFDSATGALTSRIGQRRLELDLLNRSQRLAENAQARTEANINANALLATQGGLQTIPEGVGQVLQNFTNRRANNLTVQPTERRVLDTDAPGLGGPVINNRDIAAGDALGAQNLFDVLNQSVSRETGAFIPNLPLRY